MAAVPPSGIQLHIMKSSRLLPALLLLFVGSGCAALIYEVVWFQLLELVIGSSAVSMGVLLGTFMGGMCLGSLLLPRFTEGRLRIRCGCTPSSSSASASFGLLLLFGMPLVGGVYTAWAGSGVVGILLRGVAAGICLLPPTLLMGATLPAIARWVEATPKGVAWLGFFYGGNTAGAVIGSLLAGFYLLRVNDIAIDDLCGGRAERRGRGHRARRRQRRRPYEPPLPRLGAAFADRCRRSLDGVYVVDRAVGTDGAGRRSDLDRTLSLLFGATTYTFSLILAVFLAGSASAAASASALARSLARPRMALAWCQLSLCAAMAWTRTSSRVAAVLAGQPVDLDRLRGFSFSSI